MIPIAAIDPALAGAAVTMVISAVGALLGYTKLRAESESIATRTTLEVNESLREELRERKEESIQLRRELSESQAELRKRDEEIASLKRRVEALRHDIDVLEKELDTLGGRARES